MEYGMPKSTQDWFGTVGASIGALIAISMFASGGLIVALFAAVGGVVVGGILGLLSHWAVFQLPKDIANFVEETVRDLLSFAKENWIILTVVLLGLIVFVGAR